MKAKTSKLLLAQLDKQLKTNSIPATGWIYAIRTALNMTQRQLGKKLGITAQGVKNLEENETNGTISLNRLREMAHVLNMELVYTFHPHDGSLQKMLKKAAQKTAREIVGRTATTMGLENQNNSSRRLKKAMQEKADELYREMPKYLWE